MDNQTTSEEKLLKLIRKKDQKTDESKAEQSNESKQQTRRGTGQKRPLDLLRIFKMASAVLVAVFLGHTIVQNFILKQSDINDIVSRAGVAVEGAQVLVAPRVETKPFSFYGSAINERDIFNATPKQTIRPPVMQNVQQQAPEPTKTLRLVGILLDHEPEAVVEDTETRQTIFLHKGDEVKGAIVEKIEESRVVFTYEGQTLELSQ